MCTIAICEVGDSTRSMDAAGCSPVKEMPRNFWRRKTNLFVAFPTLLSLYFIGAGFAFIICTRTILSFQIFFPVSQSPVPLFRIKPTYLSGQGPVFVPEKGALEVLEELQAPAHTLRHERGVDIFRADTNASFAQTDFDLVKDQVPHAEDAENATIEVQYDAEPDFMRMPIINTHKLVKADLLQRRLKRMTSTERKRWLKANWSLFKILEVDSVSNLFNNRMRRFFCTENNQTAHDIRNLLPDPPSLTPETLETKSMHEMDEKEICKVTNAQGNNTAFCKQRFFLTWFSPVASFTPRERLGLESIFKHHPHACVIILSRTMDSPAGRKILSPFFTRGYRIMAVTPDLTSLFANLPAEQWLNRLRDGTGDPGSINLMQNLSNIMRLAALHKYGGVYLDTDVIVLRSFAALRNVVGTQSQNMATGHWTRLNNAVLVFDRKHPVVLEFLREFVDSFDGSRWGWNGPYLVSRVLDKVLEVERWSNCSDVAVLPLQAFYPINWVNIIKYFQRPTARMDFKWQGKVLTWMNEGSYAVHLWNKRSSHLRVEEGSVMETFFKKSCLFCEPVARS